MCNLYRNTKNFLMRSSHLYLPNTPSGYRFHEHIHNKQVYKFKNNVRFAVLIAVVMKNSVFWGITPCNLLKVS
jgi:hypothetical protein